MNRLKKEAQRKYREAREGLTEAEIKKVDLKEGSEKAMADLTRKIHAEWFPEEYDFMMDSISDANYRKRGINPMSQDYIDRTNARRETFGVEPLSANGMAATKKSWNIAEDEARRQLIHLGW